jgi:hypothetical protein
MVPGGPSEDTICILYMIDSIAGFFVQGEGPVSFNPIVCQFIPSPDVGTKETMNDERGTMNVGPTIVRGGLPLGVDSRQHSSLRTDLLDATGRRVLTLKPGANDVSRLSPGVYFMRQACGVGREASSVTKVLVTR